MGKRSLEEILTRVVYGRRVSCMATIYRCDLCGKGSERIQGLAILSIVAKFDGQSMMTYELCSECVDQIGIKITELSTFKENS